MRRAVVPLLALGLLAAGCGDDEADTVSGPVDVETVPVAERAPAGGADPSVAGAATSAFGQDVFLATLADAEAGEDVVVSPLSILTALAMLEPGAVDEASAQLRDLLRIEDPQVYRASLNALTQALEARVPRAGMPDEEPGELTLRLANAAYLQRDLPFEPAYLEAIGQAFGPVLNQVDFPADPDGVAHEVNRWVAERTEDRITDLVPDGTFDDQTAFALVNALYLHASWLEPFDAAATEDGPFTRADGDEVTLPLMHGYSSSSAAGDGWVAASKDYVGGLTAQFVLPDEGRFDEVAHVLPEAFGALGGHGTGAELVLPRVETRTEAPLNGPLQALGLTAPYEGGNLTGIVDDERLVVSDVLHQTFVAIDEEGTEASAATVVIGQLLSGPVSPPVPVVLDRPFYLRIFDPGTQTTLFLGRVMDPSA